MLFLISSAAIASDIENQGHKSGDPVPDTLKAAIETAIRNRPETGIGIEQIKLEDAKYREKKGAFLPTADLFASTQYLANYDDYTGLSIFSHIDGHEVAATIERTAPTFQNGTGIEAGLNLYAGGRDTAGVEEARGRISSKEAENRILERKVILMVSRAYWELFKAQTALKSAEEELNFSRRALNVAEEQLKSSRISKIDRETSFLDVTEKETAAEDCRLAVFSRFSAYLCALGLSGKNEKSGYGYGIPDLEESPVANEYISDKERPEISRLRSDISSADARKKQADSDSHPKIDLFAKYQLNGRDDSYMASFKDIGSDNLVLGIKLTSNIFDGFRTTERQRAATSEARIARLRLELKEKEINELTINNNERFEKARNSLSLSVKRLELMEAQEKIAAVRLKNGQCSDLEHSRAKLEKNRAFNNVKLNRINVLLAKLAIDLDSPDYQ